MKRFMLLLALLSSFSLRSNPKEAEERIALMRNDMERVYLNEAYKINYYKLDAAFTLLMSTIVTTVSAQSLYKILRSNSFRSHSSNAEKSSTEKLANNKQFRILVLYALGTFFGSASIVRTLWNVWNRIALDQNHSAERDKVSKAVFLFEDWKKLEELKPAPASKKTEL